MGPMFLEVGLGSRFLEGPSDSLVKGAGIIPSNAATAVYTRTVQYYSTWLTRFRELISNSIPLVPSPQKFRLKHPWQRH